jgi:SAM-dependent methyltransferase
MNQPSPEAGYLFDGGQADQERLIRSSKALGEFTIEACVRAGLGAGGKAVDIGCGPLGALPALAELVGAAGRVVGVDANGEALTMARGILEGRGYRNVTLFQTDLARVAASDLCPPGPFDLAYMRRFLVHQKDPAAVLLRIAGLVRPGGRLVAHEIPPGSGYPALAPPVPALQRVEALVHAGIRAHGGAYAAAHGFAALCREAGVRLISQRGFLPAVEPVALLENFQDVLRSLRSSLIVKGITTAGEVDDLLGELEAAKGGAYLSSFANLYLEMIAEVP